MQAKQTSTCNKNAQTDEVSVTQNVTQLVTYDYCHRALPSSSLSSEVATEADAIELTYAMTTARIMTAPTARTMIRVLSFLSIILLFRRDLINLSQQMMIIPAGISPSDSFSAETVVSSEDNVAASSLRGTSAFTLTDTHSILQFVTWGTGSWLLCRQNHDSCICIEFWSFPLSTQCPTYHDS